MGCHRPNPTCSMGIPPSVRKSCNISIQASNFLSLNEMAIVIVFIVSSAISHTLPDPLV